MEIPNEPLVWNVYVEDINRRKIEPHNIFDHYSFIKDAKRALRKFGTDRDAFLEEIRHCLMYYYWSKCEWEVIVSSWPPNPPGREVETKIDVYDQIRLNWEHFCDYLWENRGKLRKYKLE